MIEIRKTTLNDLDRVMEIYDIARDFMARNGNPTQWGDGYPVRALIEEDIARGESYVMEEGGEIHGVFMFMQRVEPTYSKIEGAWLNDTPYGTIHRIATDGKIKRMFDKCVEFCLGITKNLRVDTHNDNIPMQKAIKRNGFTYCGVIYMLHDGTPRIAFQRQ
ncbi:MAG: N-acetyltransferase [Ruminococcaceae bacterium]|nr:N-acetyltransferase [Oscillospiraceae bacterium]